MGKGPGQHDEKQPRNQYPPRIVSPLRPGPCGFMAMADVGMPRGAGHGVVHYTRCRTCGFALRAILREFPAAAPIADLRQILATAGARNGPD